MSNIFTHPILTNEFQNELATASSTAAEVKAKANSAIAWIVGNMASHLLFKTLGECLTFKVTPGLQKKPAMLTSPPPGGPDQCAVIVMGRDGKGALRACASNAVPKPVKSEEACPAKLFDAFDALRSKTGQVQLLHQVVSSVATKDHRDDWVERVYTEGQRYRTSPVFLIVLDDGDKRHFYATTALVEGPQQIDRSLEWSGMVTQPAHPDKRRGP
jgi:hypothetical protein